MGSSRQESFAHWLALGALFLVCHPVSAIISGNTTQTYSSPTIKPTTSSAGSGSASSGVGDYVAAGLGLSTITETVTLPASSRVTLQEPSTITLRPSVGNGNSTANSTIPATILASGNRSSYNFNWTGDCWDQWNEYWSASIFDTQFWYSTESQIATTTVESAEFGTSQYFGTYTITETETYTEVSDQGAFPVATSVITSTLTESYTETDFTITLTATTGTTSFLTTETISNVSSLTTPTGGITTPICTLPSVVPQCQSQWDAWLADSFTISDVLPFTCSQTNSASCASASASWESGLSSYYDNVEPIFYASDFFTPLCTQAVVPSSACSAMMSSFLEPPMAGGGGLNWAHRSLSPWPSASVLAPGCTLGCQTCAITGRAVQLFYWPPSTANGSASYGSGSVIQTASNASQIVTAVTSGMTFTSPTAYVSYDLLYASDSCSGIGKTYRNTFLPLRNTADLSSLSFYAGDPDNEPGYSTRPFNLNDLIPPIPNSIYNQDPRCQASLELFTYDGQNASAFTCPRTAKYAPIIAIPTEVQGLDPLWKSCTAWYGGLYDPPKALQGTSVEATVTVPNSHPTTTPASPSSTGLTSLASKTSTVEPTQASADQAPSGSSAAGPGNTAQSRSTSESDDTTAGLGSTSAGNTEPGVTAPLASSASGVPTTAASGQGSIAEPSNAGLTSQAAQSPSAAGSAETQSTDLGSGSSAADPGGVIGSLLGAGSTKSAPTSDGQVAPTNAPGEPSAADPGSSNGGSDGSTSVGDAIGPSQTAAAGNSDSNTIATIASPEATDPATTEVFTFAGVTHTAVASAGSILVDGSAQQDPNAATVDPTVSPEAASAASTQVVTAGGQTLTIAIPSDPTNSAAAVVNGVSVQSGGPAATISGVVISAGSGGVALGGKTTVPFLQPAPSDSESAIVLTAGGQTLTATQLSGGGVAISSETLSVGGAAATYGSLTVSAATDGLQIDGTLAAQLPASSSPVLGSVNVITAGGQTLTASAIAQASGNAVAIAGATLTPGGAGTTLNGQTISAVSGGLVIDGTTTALSPPPASANSPFQTTLTLDGHTLTASELGGSTDNGVVVNGVTLSNGAAATVIQGVTVNAVSNGIVAGAGGSKTTIVISSTSAPAVAAGSSSSLQQSSPSAAVGTSTSTSISDSTTARSIWTMQCVMLVAMICIALM